MVHITEFDIIRSDRQDLSRASVRERLLTLIDNGKFNALLASPPCNTFSRVCFANTNGPAPVRDKDRPRGFPWATPTQKEKLRLGNLLVDFTVDALEHQIRAGGSFMALLEHPEDLGAVRDGRVPASIWQ